MKITLMSIGSTGDVRPTMQLGKELKSRGHEVTLAAFEPFEKMVRDAGLNFFLVRGNIIEMMNRVMKPGSVGFGYLPQLEKALGEVWPDMLADLTASCKDADALGCNFFGTVFYSIAEKFNIPCVQYQLFPMDPNETAPVAAAPGQNLGKLWNMTTYRVAYLLIGLVEHRYLADWRKANGLSQRKLQAHPNYQLGNHTIPVIYAISPLVFPRSKGWGEHIHMSGFWWDEKPADFAPPKELEEFLAAGEKPIYIGFGSMNSGDMNRTLTIVLRAIRAAKLRAVIATGWSGQQMRMHSTRNVFFADYVPHDWLFPRVRAVVHHGGAGTTAAGLRYGKPTLVIPFGGDQPFWGNRIFKTGCGPKPVPRNSMTVQKLTKALIMLTTKDQYRVAAEELADSLNAEHGTKKAADLLEKEILAWKEADKKETDHEGLQKDFLTSEIKKN